MSVAGRQAMMNEAIKDIERAVRLAKQVMAETPLEIL
jgi:hypothetical protein